MARRTQSKPQTLPAELDRAIATEAERDAQDVSEFLHAFTGDEATTPVSFPAAFLMGLRSALRLYRYEQQGFSVHTAIGLPCACNIVRDVVRWCGELPPQERDRHVVALHNLVLRIATRCFALEGLTILGADALIGQADEHALLDAFAQFLWETRQKGNSNGAINN